MYKDYYGLSDEPFRLTPDPKYLFLTPQHREALNHLRYGLHERKGFICLTGEVGTGKTTLCRALLRTLDSRYHTALILNPMLTEVQLLRAVIQEFGLKPQEDDRLSLLDALNRFLLDINSRGQDAVLIVDEAQDMPDATLEMVRLLSNLETDSQKLLQIILVGQDELRDKLRLPAFRQLTQRITVRYHLNKMNRTDTSQYVRHRLSVAGGSSITLKWGALRAIYGFSRGTPRLVNALGDKILLAGYVHRTDVISRKLVRMAAAELKEAA